ncbi:diguanylate cyclase (GGDEF)-like protein [Kineococcus xinjiangensis]|uniref:Diguanylate cyclase (GGDEF)-like protein n=1 Tax=Kineococcus xinjiangensis TaxID=512762 RepID=A0A2S6IST6_9ACTN|nr:EAL domain-containing protein [Kineococcus xinjiangensis]PPK97309.1 diguanylate cyclase (GGDEF)-like protein [Kineococcus xinjiangensis]
MGLAQQWQALASVLADEVADHVFPRRTLAGVLGMQYLVGGVLAVAWGVVAAMPAQARPAYLACASAALLGAALMGMVWASRMSGRSLTLVAHACIASALVLVTAGHLLAGDPGGPALLFVLWTAPYAGIFSRRARWLHVAASSAVFVVSAWWLPAPTLAQTLVETAIRIATVLCSVLLVSRMTARLRRSATQDPLTGLPNRRVLAAATRAALARQAGREGAVSMLLLDLDRFKHVNDTFGHEAGDELLRQLVPRLLAAVGPRDVVARLGGDEFAVMCEDCDGDRPPERVAARLAQVWAQPLTLAGRTLHVSGSVGVAVAGPGSTPRTLLRDADAAMYESKRGGPGGFRVFHDGLAARSNRVLQLEQGLQRAIGRGEVSVHYQPVMALTGDRAGQAVGAEALLRWHSAELGPVRPDEFIPVAEAAGLIGALGDWVLDQALTDLGDWMAAGHVPADFHVAVNVSAHQLCADLPDRVARQLARHRMPAANLGLEVTESAVLNRSTAPEALRRLHELGVTLLLDDFGTGYSSLSQLQELPFDVVKVDRSFVAGMNRHPRSRALVLAVLSLAESFGMSVVAEGVEDEEQAESLRAAGCPRVQGYFFARPAPVAEFLANLPGTAAVPAPVPVR